MKASLPVMLSLSAGYVDTAGFLALQGLFTAHVTGNFVTLGAALAFGSSGVLAKLLALPVFCIVVVLTRLFEYALEQRGLPVFRSLLTAEFCLLVLGGLLAISFGPFHDGDGWRAIVTGMVLVSAMAIQNAAHRVHLASAPPSTLMTGTTTQIMIDVADLMHGGPADKTAAARGRLVRMSANVAAFALGCGVAAGLYVWTGTWCFVLPPVMLALARFTPQSAPSAG